VDPVPSRPVDDDIPLEIEVRQGRAQVLPRRLDSDGIGRDADPIEMLGGPAIEQDIDRPDDLSPTVFRLGLSRNDLSLVGIVVQDGAALFEDARERALLIDSAMPSARLSG